MPRITMLETYTCADQTFRRGHTYDVTDARARMLTGRGSAQVQSAKSQPPAAAPPSPPVPPDAPAEEPGDETPADGTATESGRKKSKPAPRP